MIVRSERNKSVLLNIVGSSVFGRYPKISSEKLITCSKATSLWCLMLVIKLQLIHLIL
jgi:hypothetical protein